MRQPQEQEACHGTCARRVPIGPVGFVAQAGQDLWRCQPMSHQMVPCCSLRIPTTMKDAGMTGSQTCLPKQRRRKFLCDRPMVAKTSLSALDLSALKVRAPAGAQHSSHRVAAAAYLWQAEFPHLLSEATEARRFLCILLWMLLLHLLRCIFIPGHVGCIRPTCSDCASKLGGRSAAYI